MTTWLVSPSDVITRLQLSDGLEGLKDVVNSALTGAQLHVSTVLPSNLELEAQNKVFFLDSSLNSSMQPGGQFKLELPSYFIQSGAAYPLTVTYGSSRWGTDFTAVDPTLMEVDRELGQFYLDSSTYADKYVRIQCTTGFDPLYELVPANISTGAPAKLGVQPIPDWLKEGIMGYVGIVLDVSQTTKRAAQAESIYKRAGDHSLAVMARRLRKRGFVLRALNK